MWSEEGSRWEKEFLISPRRGSAFYGFTSRVIDIFRNKVTVKCYERKQSMARETPTAPPPSGEIQSQTLVVDPGAYTIKAGLVPTHDAETEPECHVIPNCMARSRTKHTYIGSSLSQCNDFGEMQFKRPVERGYIVNWDLERAIFEHEFFDPKAKLYVCRSF